MSDITLESRMRRNDRVAGAVILGLLALIAAAVCLKGRVFPEEEWLPATKGPAPAFEPPGTLLRTYTLGKTQTFDPDTLYEYIDGQAPQYLLYGFKSLLVADYDAAEKNGSPMRVDMYNMATRRNAYGIFNDSRPAEAETTSLGNEGYVSGNLAAFWKGPYYLRVQALTDDDRSETVRKAADEVAGWFEDKLGRLAEFAAFPTDHLVSGSLVFQKSAALGLIYLNDAFLAGYEKDGQSYRLFFSDAFAPGRARRIIEQHANFLGAKGKMEESRKGADEETLWGHEKYLGPTFLIAREGVVVGCVGLGDRAAAETAARELLPRAISALATAQGRDANALE